MNFLEIVSSCRSRKFALLLDGLQLNILLLLLEILGRRGFFVGDFDARSLAKILEEIQAEIEMVVRKERFISLKDLEELAAVMIEKNLPANEDLIKSLIEKKWNGRTG